MTALWIVCGVLLFFALLLFIPIGVELRYDGEIAVAVRVLCFRYRIMPKKQKKIKLRRFTKKRYERMLAKERKKEAKKAAKKAEKAAEKAAKAEKEKSAGAAGKKKESQTKLISDMWQMRSLIMRIVRRFIGRVRTERMRVRLVIGSDNAAQSALIYGAAANAAVDMQEILRTQTNLRRECEIELGVDFTSETTVADVYVRLAVTLASALAAAISFIFGFLKHKIKQG